MAKDFYQKMLYENESALRYVKERKLEENTLQMFSIGYSDPKIHIYDELKKQGFDELDIMASGLVADQNKTNKVFLAKDRYDKFYNRIIFPIKNENNIVIGFGGRVMDNKKPKYINSQETIAYDKSANLFGLNIARYSKFDYFLLCEGYMDVISMHQAGFDNAIASLGTSLTLNQLIKLSKYKKKIILTYDSDEPGLNAAKRAIPMLESCMINTKIINLNPYKDPDEFIKEVGKDEFLKQITIADESYPWLIANIMKSDKTLYEQKIENIATIFEEQYKFM